MTIPESERVTLLVGGKEYGAWSECELHDQIDSISTVSFKAPFEPDRKEFRDIFRPFTYPNVEVKVGGFQFFAGRMVSVAPDWDANSNTVEITAYAHAGWLNDVTMPGDKYPIEYKKLGLYAIATKLGEPFGIKVRVVGDEGSKFEKVRLEEDKKIWNFLAELAQQRNFVLSNTPDGQLLVWRSVDPGNPAAHLKGDESPITKISAEFSPQEYYSEITCFSKTTRKKRGNQYTAKNPFLNGILRPLAFRAQDTAAGDAPDAARAKIGRMLGNMASFTIDNIPTWRDPSDRIWAPNTTLLVGPAPRAMIYRKSELLVRGVTLKQTANELSASLNVVLPGSFSGKAPEHLPWVE